MDIIATSESTWKESAGSVVIADYNQGFNDGVETGSLAVDAILDGTAFADGTYTNNTVKSLRKGVLKETGVSKIYFPNVENLQDQAFFQNTTLTYVYLPKLKSAGMQSLGLCTKITGDWSFLEQIEDVSSQAFRGCQLPESITFAELTTNNSAWGSPFDEVPTTKHMRFPKMQTYNDRFIDGDALETVELGSVGYPVTRLHSNTCGGNTSITSITVYCEDPNNPPTGSPWGAPNATVTFLKA